MPQHLADTPTIPRRIGGRLGESTGIWPIPWIVDAYVLALTVSVAAAGRLGDLVGHRPVFIVGATTLGVGSVIVGVAQGTELLIAGASGL